MKLKKKDTFIVIYLSLVLIGCLYIAKDIINVIEVRENIKDSYEKYESPKSLKIKEKLERGVVKLSQKY